jgi:hypothetical protein
LKFLEKANQRSAQQARPISQPTAAVTTPTSNNPSLPSKTTPTSLSSNDNTKKNVSSSQTTTTAKVDPDLADVIDHDKDTQGPPDFLAVAMFDFDGQREQHEISFKFGDIVALYTDECRPTDDWWQGVYLELNFSFLSTTKTFNRNLTFSFFCRLRFE